MATIRQSFNTVNGIRVHAMTTIFSILKMAIPKFQYRKRYKGACNADVKSALIADRSWFQYRKRYKGACNVRACARGITEQSFNTVNGIRVHAIGEMYPCKPDIFESFNTVNGIRVHAIVFDGEITITMLFQYRKRYKGACNS